MPRLEAHAGALCGDPEVAAGPVAVMPGATDLEGADEGVRCLCA
jgi:hypothetical protein